MEFFKNFPLFTIILAFVAVVLCAILKGKASRIITIIVDSISVAFGICVLILTLKEYQKLTKYKSIYKISIIDTYGKLKIKKQTLSLHDILFS